MLCSAWGLLKDISKLQKHEIEAFIQEPYRRSDTSLSYKIALVPEEWETGMAAGAEQAAESAAITEVDGESACEDDEPKA